MFGEYARILRILRHLLLEADFVNTCPSCPALDFQTKFIIFLRLNLNVGTLSLMWSQTPFRP